jgi:hypothetical protein
MKHMMKHMMKPEMTKERRDTEELGVPVAGQPEVCVIEDDAERRETT